MKQSNGNSQYSPSKCLSRKCWGSKCPGIRRKRAGSAISEFGPALFLIMFGAVLPMLDLIFAGLSYCSCTTLNSLQIREAVMLPRSEAISATGPIQQDIVNRWKATGIGQFTGLVSDPTTVLSYSDGSQTLYGKDVYVTVATTVTVKPFLTIPFFVGIPGLGAPSTYTVVSKRLLENPNYASL